MLFFDGDNGPGGGMDRIFTQMGFGRVAGYALNLKFKHYPPFVAVNRVAHRRLGHHQFGQRYLLLADPTGKHRRTSGPILLIRRSGNQ